MRHKIYVKNLCGDCRGCANLEWRRGTAYCSLFPPVSGGRELNRVDTPSGNTYPQIPEWCPLPDGSDHEKEVRYAD